MKLRMPLFPSALALLLLLSSCSGSTPIQVSCDDFMKLQSPAVVTKKVSVPVGSTFTVTLCSNQTTGYRWSELAQISDQSLLRQIDHKFEPPQSGLIGAAGQEVWTFETLEKGTCTVSMEYSRPWEGGEKATWRFNLILVIK